MQQMDRTSEQTGIQDLMARSLICLGNGCHVVVMSVLRWQNKLYGSPEIKYSIILALPMQGRQTIAHRIACCMITVLNNTGKT
jgi:hypothetical protein